MTHASLDPSSLKRDEVQGLLLPEALSQRLTLEVTIHENPSPSMPTAASEFATLECQHEQTGLWLCEA